MEPGIFNFTIYQGQDLSLVFTCQTEGGLPVNLLGYVARLQCRATDIATGTSLFAASTTPGTGEGSLVLGGASGNVSLTLPATITATFASWTLGYYDLLLIAPGGIHVPVMYGTVTVLPMITTTAP